MKKTLAVAAVLAAFAGSAAADVTVYGAIDLGLAYTHANDGTDTVQFKSGMDTASRVGFIATEKIGDVTVGAKFENSFDAMTGKDGELSKGVEGFFNRETRLFVQTPYGEVGAGRFGALDSTTGPYNLAGSSIHATTGINGIGATGVVFLGQNSRVANTIAYKSPKFAGVQVYAQYASADGKNTHETERYYALGARYQAGALMATLVGSLEDGADTPAASGHEKGQETKAYTAALSYDFGVTKALVAAQYFDNALAGVVVEGEKVLTDATYKVRVDGYGLTVGAVTPVAGGTLKTQFGYMKAENVAGKAEGEYDAWNVGALYYYNFSKRTSVYGGLGYTVQGMEGADDVKTVNGAIGLIHNF